MGQCRYPERPAYYGISLLSKQTVEVSMCAVQLDPYEFFSIIQHLIWSKCCYVDEQISVVWANVLCKQNLNIMT